MASAATTQPSAAKASAPAARKASKAEPLWTRSFIAGTLLNFFIAANYFMLMVVMTAYALNVYQAPAALAAFCASVFVLGTLVSRFVSAPLMERFGRVPVLAASAIVEVILTALYLLNVPLGALIAVRVVQGFAYGVCSTTIATVVTSIVPASRKGEGIGYFMLSITLGSALGPSVGIFLSSTFGYSTLFAVASIVVALAVPCTLLLRPAKSTVVKGSPAKAKAQTLAAVDALAGAESAAPQEEVRDEKLAVCLDECEGAKAPSAPVARAAACATCDSSPADCPACTRVPSTHLEEKITDKVEHCWLHRFVVAGVLPISVVCGLLFFGYSSLLTFLTPYATQAGMAQAAGVFFLVYAAAMFVTRPFTGRAFDRKGPHPVMIPAFLSFAAGMVLVALAPNGWVLLAAAALLGFGVGTVQSCGLAMAVRVTSDASLSVANATFYMLLDLGCGVGPILLGVLVPLIGYQALYLCMAAVGLLAFALFLVVAKTEKGAR